MHFDLRDVSIAFHLNYTTIERILNFRCFGWSSRSLRRMEHTTHKQHLKIYKYTTKFSTLEIMQYLLNISHLMDAP